jgi:drug/metabolite transporter (DMT)-like permease
MSGTKLGDFLKLHLLFLYYSFVIVVSKIAASYEFLSPKFLLFYGIELAMIMVYAFFWQKIIKKFSLVAAFSNKGIIIFWTLIWSVLFFNDSIRVNHIIGMVIIIAGITMVVKDDE